MMIQHTTFSQDSGSGEPGSPRPGSAPASPTGREDPWVLEPRCGKALRNGMMGEWDNDEIFMDTYWIYLPVVKHGLIGKILNAPFSLMMFPFKPSYVGDLNV